MNAIERFIGNAEAWLFRNGDLLMQQTANRVTAATMGGAVAVVLIWILKLAAGIEPGPEVVVAITTIVQGVVQALYSLIRGFSPKATVRTPWWLVVPLLAVFWLAGCAGNPVKEAETAEQKAFAAYGLFVVLEERAASLMAEPTVSDATKLRIQRLDARLKPMADSVLGTARLAQEVRDEVAAGEGTEARLQTITRELNGWLLRFLPLLDDFKSAVRG